ncbi:hypothetical protein OBBRIDRAFT_888829 [Obba rivulosa]|uniref:Uncharacterized protein n=1 Tax=Obba rivulosa TaxID=1052685 RepID=A0A8E2AQ35_9APHY|nr:hypothetical protein OBBRIDRAFT_888829 [Obba rivulosa]
MGCSKSKKYFQKPQKKARHACPVPFCIFKGQKKRAIRRHFERQHSIGNTRGKGKLHNAKVDVCGCGSFSSCRTEGHGHVCSDAQSPQEASKSEVDANTILTGLPPMTSQNYMRLAAELVDQAQNTAPSGQTPGLNSSQAVEIASKILTYVAANMVHSRDDTSVPSLATATPVLGGLRSPSLEYIPDGTPGSPERFMQPQVGAEQPNSPDDFGLYMPHPATFPASPAISYVFSQHPGSSINVATEPQFALALDNNVGVLRSICDTIEAEQISGEYHEIRAALDAATHASASFASQAGIEASEASGAEVNTSNSLQLDLPEAMPTPPSSPYPSGPGQGYSGWAVAAESPAATPECGTPGTPAVHPVTAEWPDDIRDPSTVGDFSQADFDYYLLLFAESAHTSTDQALFSPGPGEFYYAPPAGTPGPSASGAYGWRSLPRSPSLGPSAMPSAGNPEPMSEVRTPSSASSAEVARHLFFSTPNTATSTELGSRTYTLSPSSNETIAQLLFSGNARDNPDAPHTPSTNTEAVQEFLAGDTGFGLGADEDLVF